MKFYQFLKISLSISGLILMGCGGSSDTKESISEVNITPTITVADLTVNEKADVIVDAIVSGQGSSLYRYQWKQTSGPAVTLIDADKANVSFTAPEVSEDAIIGLSLTFTDTDGDIIVSESVVNVEQVTLALTITGQAIGSTLSNAKIEVNIAGHEAPIEVLANENGEYTVDLLLDDSEADAFISIIAKGVETHTKTGLISLLGTLAELRELAGEDNILTRDEEFSVNISIITTAQYALAKFANNDQAMLSGVQYENILQNIDGVEVIKLATAIKMATEKSDLNEILTLPEEVSDTLALIESPLVMDSYLRGVETWPEYKTVEQEVYNDNALIDTYSPFTAPKAYSFINRNITGGLTFRFDAGQGTQEGNTFDFTETNGVISAVVSKPVTTYRIEEILDYVYMTPIYVYVDAEITDMSYELKRLDSGGNSDVILLTTTKKKHSPEGLFEDEIFTETLISTAIRDSGNVSINQIDAGIAYLPVDNIFISDESKKIYAKIDEFKLNEDGTGHATLLDIDFNWQNTDGVLELTFPADGESEERVVSWSQLTNEVGGNHFQCETKGYIYNFCNNITGNATDSDEYINKGAIISSKMSWDLADIPGKYTYYGTPFTLGIEYELHENGEADSNYGIGSWKLNEDGTLTISRVVNDNGQSTRECRYEETEGCVLYLTDTWRLIGQFGNRSDIIYTRDRKYSNFYERKDAIYNHPRTVYKLNSTSE
ncbi:PKD domain-containing protein [Pseudoalteromonas denitrificans]|uniref:Uncharacterized protein n=1 Tax=Pseudoalteromonas denitrificans DSM 6059 TaxID=1123010 RepID=A0A1I1P3Z2_9GAMM|nr:hypothetical protein [Pseudoalteromonas denitrificans]SFD04549.1 hypothetical protein SAMN02745724_03295 [Pseudoalteromonas denitrificans DSM 6059]